MTEMSWIVLASTVAALLAIAVGVILPAFAMGKAISSALEALAHRRRLARIAGFLCRRQPAISRIRPASGLP